LDVVANEKLVENAAEQGAYLRRELESLGEDHPLLRDTRGAGLFLGAELAREASASPGDAEAARTVVNALRDDGVLVGRTGPGDNVVKIRPPLPIRRDEADLFLSAFDRALSVAERGARSGSSSHT
jgi:4-aminobutyrate aminotransferase-like enzyme